MDGGNKPWSAKGLLDLLITLFCGAISSIVSICFKNYYLALILIIAFLIAAIVTLAIFYSELRITYNSMAEKLNQMIDVQKINKEALEEKLKQGNFENFNAEPAGPKRNSENLSSQDPKEHDEAHQQ